jgi:hypothetical protein
MPVILVVQEAEIRKITVQSQPWQIVCETLSQKYPSLKGLVEWLKVKALSLRPSFTRKKEFTCFLCSRRICPFQAYILFILP